MRMLVRLALVLVVLLLGAAGAAYYFWLGLEAPYRGYAGEAVFVDVPPGTGPRALGRRLVDAGVVRDETTWRAALFVTGRAPELKAGEYRFDAPMTPRAVVDKIASGDVFRRLITFREGLTIEEMADVWAEREFGDRAAFVEAARNPAPIADLDPAARDLEGYLFPETYALPRTTTADDLVRQMVALFKENFDAGLRQAAADAGLSVREAVTLASLVEKETALAEERPVVSAVYNNRLRIGMGMQADPTVIYALQRAGRYDGNLRRADLQFDSPYNTYRYRGLPPGPIAAPGRASLEAAVRPADVPYLYFVSRNDGSHVFATTLAEHNRNVQEWQVRYFRERRNRSASPPQAPPPQ